MRRMKVSATLGPSEMSSSEISYRSRRTMRFCILAWVLTGFLLAAPLEAYASDAWAGIRYCAGFETCRVKSYATGSVKHERCDTSGDNCVLKASWANGGTYSWRTSTHGSGSQMALISTTGTLSSQSATCVCVSPPCPDSPGDF